MIKNIKIQVIWTGVTDDTVINLGTAYYNTSGKDDSIKYDSDSKKFTSQLYIGQDIISGGKIMDIKATVNVSSDLYGSVSEQVQKSVSASYIKIKKPEILGSKIGKSVQVLFDTQTGEQYPGKDSKVITPE